LGDGVSFYDSIADINMEDYKIWKDSIDSDWYERGGRLYKLPTVVELESLKYLALYHLPDNYPQLDLMYRVRVGVYRQVINGKPIEREISPIWMY